VLIGYAHDQSKPPKKTVSARPILRKSYNEDFKRDAVKLAESIGATQAAHDLGIDRSLISAWKQSLATTEPAMPPPEKAHARLGS
jgi:transposase-like protein